MRQARLKRKTRLNGALATTALGFLFACSSTVSHPPTVPVVPAGGQASEHLNPNCKANSNAAGQSTWAWTSTAVSTSTKPTGETANSPANGAPAAGTSGQSSAGGQPGGSTLALDATGGATPVTWSTIKGVLTANCMGSCHQHDNYSTYASAVADGPEMLQRTDLDPSAQQFMPQGGQKLDLADRELLIQWVNAGMPNDNGAIGTATSTATDTGKGRFTTPQQGTASSTPQPTGC
jgi:hypothetical protein